MKAVFIHQNCLFRDSHIDPDARASEWSLAPATLEAVRLLGTEERLVLVFGNAIHDEAQSAGGIDRREHERLVKQVEAAGGRIDGLLLCPHQALQQCCCSGDSPAILWLAAAQFNLQLDECYVLGDSGQDAAMASAVGARPMLILGSRRIVDVLGNLPQRRDYPLAENLTTAVSYIGVEEDISRQLGHPRTESCPAPADDVLYADRDALPTLIVTSSLAEEIRGKLVRSRVQLRDITRWLSFFVLGTLGLSLGIAYLLTHLYRVQPFPQFAYYVTLQFIPRPVRGALFIAWGIGVIALAIRSFYRSAALELWRRRRR